MRRTRVLHPAAHEHLEPRRARPRRERAPTPRRGDMRVLAVAVEAVRVGRDGEAAARRARVRQRGRSSASADDRPNRAAGHAQGVETRFFGARDDRALLLHKVYVGVGVWGGPRFNVIVRC